MIITINGQKTEIPEGFTIADVLSARELRPETVIVEYNYGIAKKELWAQTVLKENDVIEILRFVGGG